MPGYRIKSTLSEDKTISDDAFDLNLVNQQDMGTALLLTPVQKFLLQINRDKLLGKTINNSVCN